MSDIEKEVQRFVDMDCFDTCQVWADFIAMAAITISNGFDWEGKTHDDREKQYMRTIKGYNQREQQIFPKLFALLVEALEDESDQDFLGEMFMALNLGNHWKGQFYTPYSICRMMSEITVEDLEPRIEGKSWVGIHDPCCGAGALLIAARNTMVRKKLGPSAALYVAQDIDRTVALMCYLRLSLLGCAGYVVVADSILHPIVGPGQNPLLISPTPGRKKNAARQAGVLVAALFGLGLRPGFVLVGANLGIDSLRIPDAGLGVLLHFHAQLVQPFDGGIAGEKVLGPGAEGDDLQVLHTDDRPRDGHKVGNHFGNVGSGAHRGTRGCRRSGAASAGQEN